MLLGRAARGTTSRYVATRRVEVNESGARKIHEERIVRDGRRVRIEFAPGSRYEGQRVIETADGRFVVDPRRREIRRLPGRGPEAERRLGRFVRLAREGRISLRAGDGGKIAGVPTRRLVLSREGRPFLALSVEPKSAVVLRRESFGPAGRSAGNYVFTRFEPRAKIDPANFVIPKNGYRTIEPLTDLRALGKREGIAIRVLPPSTGYRLEGARSRKTSGGTILASFYSGGGKRLTLFATVGELPQLPDPNRRGGDPDGSPEQSPDVVAGRGPGGNGSRIAPSGVSLYRWRVGRTNYGLLGEESLERLRALAGASTP